MKRSRFTEDQIIGILKEHEAGVSVADLCRMHGVSDAIVYKWKAKYGGMDVSEAKRLRGSKTRTPSEADAAGCHARQCGLQGAGGTGSREGGADGVGAGR